MHHMYGNWGSTWDWLWMTVMVFVWVVVLGGVVYAAVRLVLKHEQKPPVSS